jgi:hypothetical protein
VGKVKKGDSTTTLAEAYDEAGGYRLSSTLNSDPKLRHLGRIGLVLEP